MLSKRHSNPYLHRTRYDKLDHGSNQEIPKLKNAPLLFRLRFRLTRQHYPRAFNSSSPFTGSQTSSNAYGEHVEVTQIARTAGLDPNASFNLPFLSFQGIILQGSEIEL